MSRGWHPGACLPEREQAPAEPGSWCGLKRPSAPDRVQREPACVHPVGWPCTQQLCSEPRLPHHEPGMVLEVPPFAREIIRAPVRPRGNALPPVTLEQFGEVEDTGAAPCLHNANAAAPDGVLDLPLLDPRKRAHAVHPPQRVHIVATILRNQ